MDFLNFLSRTFNRSFHPNWIAFFVALGVALGFLLVIIDYGVSVWKIILPFGIFFLAIGLMELKIALDRRKDFAEMRWQWKLERQKVERLRKFIKDDPEFRTDCSVCAYCGDNPGECQRQTRSEEKFFHFNRFDNRSYCLNWKKRI